MSCKAKRLNKFSNYWFYVTIKNTVIERKVEIMSKRKWGIKIILIVILLLILYLCFFAPPIMICKDGPILADRASGYDDSEAYIDEAYNDVDKNVHYTTDFDYFYVINFRFWEQIEIRQFDFLNNNEEIKEAQINPWMYKVPQNQKDSDVNMFEVSRGENVWYFSYFAALI